MAAKSQRVLLKASESNQEQPLHKHGFKKQKSPTEAIGANVSKNSILKDTHAGSSKASGKQSLKISQRSSANRSLRVVVESRIPEKEGIGHPEKYSLYKRPSERIIGSRSNSKLESNTPEIYQSSQSMLSGGKSRLEESSLTWAPQDRITGLKVIIVPNTQANINQRNQSEKAESGLGQARTNAGSSTSNHKDRDNETTDIAVLRSSGVSFGGWMRVVPLNSDDEAPRSTRASKPIKVEKQYNLRQQLVPERAKSSAGTSKPVQSSRSLPRSANQAGADPASRKAQSTKSLPKKQLGPVLQNPVNATGDSKLQAPKANPSKKALLANREADQEHHSSIIFHDDPPSTVRDSQEILIQEVKVDSSKPFGKFTSRAGGQILGAQQSKLKSPSKRSQSTQRSTAVSVAPKLQGKEAERGLKVSSPAPQKGNRSHSPASVKQISKPSNNIGLPGYNSVRVVPQLAEAKLYTSEVVGPSSPRFGDLQSKRTDRQRQRSGSRAAEVQTVQVASTVVVSQKSTQGQAMARTANPQEFLKRIVCEPWVDSVPQSNLPRTTRTGGRTQGSSKLQSARDKREIEKLSRLSSRPETAKGDQGGRAFLNTEPKSLGYQSTPNYYSSGAELLLRLPVHRVEVKEKSGQKEPKSPSEEKGSLQRASRPASVRMSRADSPQLGNSDQKWFRSSNSPQRRSGSLRSFRPVNPLNLRAGDTSGPNSPARRSGSRRSVKLGSDVQNSGSRRSSLHRLLQGPRVGQRSKGLTINTNYVHPVSVINQSGVFKVIVQRTPTAPPSTH